MADGAPLRIGLLECDHVDDRHRDIDGDYQDMFRARLQAAEPHLELVTYDARHGQLPGRADECDGWVGTGSRSSVYDEETWITGLISFVRAVHDGGVPYVGICFGHQLLAQALGGRVERAPGGWGVGTHLLKTHSPEPWMDPPLEAPRLIYLHQDQVTALPPGATALASSVHCPLAMFRVDRTMLGVQAHPEFAASYVDAVLADRAARIGPDVAAAGRRSLATPTDEATVLRWIVAFLSSPRHGITPIREGSASSQPQEATRWVT